MEHDEQKLLVTRWGFLQVAKLPSEEELTEHYVKKYYQELTSKTYQRTYQPEEVEHREWGYKKMEHILVSSYGVRIPRGRILDVGAGEGYCMAYFHGRGAVVFGCDLSEHAVLSHNPRMIEYFQKGDFFQILENLRARGSQYDIVICDNVLEHVTRPEVLVNHIRALLAPGGVAVFEVPNDHSEWQHYLLSSGKVDRPYWIGPPEHLNYFQTDSLRNFLKEMGFDRIRVYGDYPIEIHLMHSRTNYVKDPQVGKECHLTRCAVENFLCRKDLGETVSLSESLARLNLCRVLTAYAESRGD